jgi:hypothetical protein
MALETQRGEVEVIDKEINNADKVIFDDPVFQPLRKKRRLIPVHAFDETHHANLPAIRKRSMPTSFDTPAAHRGRSVPAERIFDEMFSWDIDGGPTQVRAYADLKAALAELDEKLDGTGLQVVPQSRRDGWRLVMVAGGAFVA